MHLPPTQKSLLSAVTPALIGLTLAATPAFAQDAPQPPDIPGLTLHLDASDTDAMTLVDGRVTEWRSSTSSDIVFTPAENHGSPGDWAPDWVSGEANTERPLNNRPVVRFSGSSSLTSNSPEARAMTNNIGGLTFFGVGWNTEGGAQVYLRIRGGTGVVRVFFYRATNDHRLGGRRLDSDANQTLTSPTGTRLQDVWGIDSAIVDYTNANAFLHINGEEVAFTDSWQTPGLVSPTDSMEMSVGSDNRTPERTQLWNGDIAEILFFNRVLSPDEFHAVGSYLAEKYDLEWPEVDTEVIDLSINGPVQELSFPTEADRDYFILHTEDGETWRRTNEDPIPGTGETIAMALPFADDAASFRIVERIMEAHIPDTSGTPDLTVTDGLRLHLDASDTANVVLDDSGIRVSEWRNSAAEEMVFTQDDPARRPILLDDPFINNRPILIFDNAFMETTSNAALGLTNNAAALTFFGVGWNRGTGAQNFIRISKGGSASVTAARAMFYRATNDHRAIGGRLDEAGTETIIGTPRLREEWGIDSTVLDFANAEAFLHINGREAGRSLSFLDGGNISPIDAHRFRIAANTADNPGQLWDGDIPEMLLYDRALSMEERNEVGIYLANKYNLNYLVTTEVDVDFEVAEGVRLEFSTQLGNRYQVQVSESLAGWENLGAPIDGIGVNEVVFVSFTGADKSFFRVIRVD